MFSPPAVAGDHVYAASCAGSFFDLDRETGDVIWSYDTRQDGDRTEFHGTAVLTEGTALIATDDRQPEAIGHVYALDRATGEPRWKQPFENGVATDLLVEGGVVYFATYREQVMAMTLSDGETIWSFDAGSPTERLHRTSSPMLTESHVIYGGVDGTIRALDRSTGEPVWERSLGSRVSASPIGVDESILVGTENAKLHLLKSANGEPVASLELPGTPFGRPLEVNGSIVVFMTGRYAAAIDRALKSTRWQIQIGTDWATFRPLLVDQTILAGADDHRVYALSEKTGALVWMQEFDGPVTSLTYVAGDRDELYVGTTAGTVHATRFAR